jgi:hypothetical protein
VDVQHGGAVERGVAFAGVPEARHLLAVRRADPVDGRGDQPVAELLGKGAATVDQRRRLPRRDVDREDRSRVGRSGGGEQEARSVRGPHHGQRYDGREVEVTQPPPVGVVDREPVLPVDVVADQEE